VREMPNDNRLWKHTRLRSSKYLNNLIEQDHRGIKARTNPMLGFKSFSSLPLPEWSCFGVSIRLNSPSVASASKTKLRLHSGMQSSLLDLKHRRQLHADHQKICTRAKLRTSKYLNNMIEQDHRGIKSRTRSMLGFSPCGMADGSSGLFFSLILICTRANEQTITSSLHSTSRS
jgi:transposase-like protein